MGTCAINDVDDIKLNFHQCVMKCIATPDLVREFDRLTGHNLSRKGSPLELAIDDATGRTEAGCREFIEFVLEFLWMPLAEEKEREVEI